METLAPKNANGIPLHKPVDSMRGATVPDLAAVGDECESQASWQKRKGIKPEERIRLLKVAHMRYQHPDLDEITQFLLDFGLTVVKRTETQVWCRGYGPDQYVYYAQQGPKEFLGGTFAVESYKELEKAAQLQGAGRITELSDAPGGGFMLSLRDPQGFPLNLLYGQEPAETGPLPTKLLINSESEKPRVRNFQRFQPGPAAVHKLGHFGFCTQELPGLMDFYARTFNLVPSDILHVPGPDGSKHEAAVFMHVDRGTEAVDHHTFFLSENPGSRPHVHHASFEVHDYDTQNLGHQWLARKGYRSVWGVGRHILGSQIFDYWWDTAGNMIEHYADGDLINEETPIGYGPAGHESLAVWGPEVPKSFLD